MRTSLRRSFSTESNNNKSTESTVNSEYADTILQKLLAASLYHAKHRGFTDEAIVAACRDLDLPSVTGSMLKNGPYDIVQFAMD